MKSISRCFLWLALPLLAALTGCAGVSLPYQPSIDNVEAIKRSSGPVAIGAFTVAAGAPGAASISLRANTMASSVGSDYAAYLAEAIRNELQLAGKLDPKSQVVVSGTLLKNNVNVAGFSTGEGEIQARFIVTRSGAVQFDKVKRAEASWDSSYAAAIAIPKAQQEYPLLVQKLLGSLMSDPDFLTAVK